MGLGLGFKLHSRSNGAITKPDDDDQWYIPYKGPVEPPRDLPRRVKRRDSWGDLVDPNDDDDDADLADKELQERFREYGETASRHSSKADADEHKPIGRERAFSVMSGRTGSSGAIDPTRNSVLTPRRSTVSTTYRPPLPAYIHLDGGVGESPAPHIHPKDMHLNTRLSLASIFSFGSSSRKNHASPSRSRKSSLRRSKSKSHANQTDDRPHPYANLPDSQYSPLEEKPLISPTDMTKVSVDPDDYYNSYYTTLQYGGPDPNSIRQNDTSGHDAGRPSTSSTVSGKDSVSTLPTHPYAHPALKRDVQDGSGAVVASGVRVHANGGQDRRQQVPIITQPRLRNPPRQDASRTARLKSPASSPDLRNPQVSRTKSTPAPKLKDRWLSAETWCDAILFPRPRFKVKEQPADPPPRIVSPPDTPIEEKFSQHSATAAVPSRVLAHSRSLVNLNHNRTQPTSKRVEIPNNAASPQPPPSITVTPSNTRPIRPRSFAADDLALINPVFSVQQVLEEGEALHHQRKRWQQQATSSIGNSTARNLARTRSKSLTQKGRKVPRHQTSMDYLAARACLGTQNVSPEIHPARPRTSSASTVTQSVGRPSHSHSNSLGKTVSRSSNGHSRSYSQSETWNRPAQTTLRLRQEPERDQLLEGALRRDDTRVIRFPDPALIPIDRTTPTRISPIPSGSSDVHMGIAISTPPVPDDALDRESIRMPAHPYASAGLYTRVTNASADGHEKRTERVGSDYAGPHPIETPHQPSTYTAMSSHPYARVVSPEVVFASQSRDGNEIPMHDKMWAQLSPGVLREVHPDELQYSPFLPEEETRKDSTPPPAVATSNEESVGLGEALTYASYRDSRDSGIGTSEGHVIQPYVPTGSPQQLQLDTAPKVHRAPIQYDATRSAFHKKSLSTSTIANGPAALPSSDLLLPIPEVSDQRTTPTSGTPSPPASPRSLGSPNDLDSFHDLFYQPSSYRQSAFEPVEDRPISQSASLTWEFANRGHRTNSGLASLARQLSEEFEELEKTRSTIASQYSLSNPGSLRMDSNVRTTMEGGLQFVFEEHHSDSPAPGGTEIDQDPTMLIKPTFNIPEDVASFTGSSINEKTVEDEDETAVFRVGMVDAIATPPAEAGDHRRSLTVSYDTRFPRDAHHSASEAQLSPLSPYSRASSGLQPPDMLRSSYMTTSTTSRISGLSDFPIPPKGDNGHMSLLTAYFDENARHDSQALRETPHPFSPTAQRFAFSEEVRTEHTNHRQHGGNHIRSPSSSSQL